jgi:outer membrane protein TolC
MRRITAISLLLLFGCSTSSTYERPALELPQAWKESAPRFAEDGRWWRIYQDPALEAFMEESFKSNGDLVVAAARVDEARAVLGEARSLFFPRVDAQGSAARQQI